MADSEGIAMEVIWARCAAIDKPHVRFVAVSSLRHDNFLLWDSRDVTLSIRYAYRMKAGDRFPMMEVCRRKDARYVVGNGNHRLYAVRRLGLKRVPVIVYDNWLEIG